MDEVSVLNAYRRYARNYNWFFGKIFEQGRRQVVRYMNCQPGDRTLDVGIGTGLSLNFYPKDTFVVGIDISPDMLAVARRVIGRSNACNVCLSQMDAQKLCFPDNTFDKVAAMYVASVVPDPYSMTAEMKRVCKPDGDIFILNHFSNSHLLPKMVEKILVPFENVIGFRPRFPLEHFIDSTSLNVVSLSQVNLFGYWTLIHARNGVN
jgi:phosphatidylethanolamine/phosphatidyl-N-methylethanolamine N-methyltransferase